MRGKIINSRRHVADQGKTSAHVSITNVRYQRHTHISLLLILEIHDSFISHLLTVKQFLKMFVKDGKPRITQYFFHRAARNIIQWLAEPFLISKIIKSENKVSIDIGDQYWQGVGDQSVLILTISKQTFNFLALLDFNLQLLINRLNFILGLR